MTLVKKIARSRDAKQQVTSAVKRIGNSLTEMMRLCCDAPRREYLEVNQVCRLIAFDQRGKSGTRQDKIMLD
jgi:hypothetical protein